MPASNKVGTQLLVSPHLRDRARALAIIRQESVAEVWRAALEGAGLPGLEQDHEHELGWLGLAFAAMRVDRAWALEDMLSRRLRLADLRTPDGTPRRFYPRDEALARQS